MNRAKDHGGDLSLSGTQVVSAINAAINDHFNLISGKGIGKISAGAKGVSSPGSNVKNVNEDIPIVSKGVINDGGDLSVSGISRGTDVQDTEIKSGRMVGISGATQERGSKQRSIERSYEFDNLHRSRQKRSAKELNLDHGDDSTKVSIVSIDSNEDTKASAEYAKLHGYKAVAFADANLSFDNGRISARGVFDKKSKTVYVRADRTDFTALQITKHEVFHGYLSEGKEYKVNRLLKNIKKAIGGENLKHIRKMYGDAYNNSGLSDHEITEEMLCDFNARMNIFSAQLGEGTKQNEMYKKLLWAAHNEAEHEIDGNKDEDSKAKLNEIDQEELERKYSIVFDAVDKDSGKALGTCVLLDTDKVKGVSPRNWGKIVADYIDERVKKSTCIMPVNDENGREQIVEFANQNDRTSVNNGNSFKVLGKIKRIDGNTQRLSVLHVDEVMQASYPQSEDYRTEQNPKHKHGWLDANGFLHRKAKVINASNGSVYEINMDIAKASDGRHILYVLNKPKRIGAVQVNSPALSAGGSQTHPRSRGIKTQEKQSVNQKFSMELPVEQTKNLIAVHNLTDEKLKKVISLGGFPMPSIAVTKTDIGHTNFGDISLVMDKSVVDPQADPRNNIYSADVWSPTVPSLEYEANPKVVQSLKKLYYDIYKKFGRDIAEGFYRIGNTFEDFLNREGGIEGVINFLKDDVDAKNFYLAATDGHPVKPIIQNKVDRMTDDEIKIAKDTIKTVGKENIPRYLTPFWVKEHNEYIEKISGNHRTNESDARKSAITAIRLAARYNRGDIEKVTNEVDKASTDKAINKAVSQTEYESWLNKIFKGAVKDSGVYNNKDIYTRSGERKSFKQTHYPNTLEGLVKAMSSQNEGNIRNVGGFHGIKSLRSSTATRFNSIEEMHQSEWRLKHRTQIEADDINNALSDRLSEIIHKIYDSASHGHHDNNYFIAADRIGNNLIEIAENGAYGEKTIKQTLNKYGYKISLETATAIKNLLSDISKMQVDIFEAKPAYSVGFDKVLAAVLPSDVDSDLADQLRNVGVNNILTYKAGDEADRLEKINSVEDAQFSIEAKIDSDTAKKIKDTASKLKDKGGKNNDISRRSRNDGTQGDLGGGSDFRRLQEESRRIANTTNWKERSSIINENLRKRLSGILGRELQRRGSSNGNGYESVVVEGKGNKFKVYTNVDADTYHDIFEIARIYTVNGELVDLHPVKTVTDENGDNEIGYNDCINYLSSDGMAGFSVTDSGDLISVFNTHKDDAHRGWIEAIRPIVNEVAVTCDCYDAAVQPLPRMYERKLSWKIASVMDHNMDFDHDDIAKNYNDPKVAFLVNTDKAVEIKYFDKDSYDRAKAYRDSFIDNVKQISKKAVSQVPNASDSLRSHVQNELEPTVSDGSVAQAKDNDNGYSLKFDPETVRRAYNKINNPSRWEAERVGDANKKPMSMTNIIAKVRHDFGLNITNGYVRAKNVNGFFDPKNKNIRTKYINNLPTTAHELGHALSDRFDIVGNKDLPKELAVFEELADEFNAYYALDADTATSSIRLAEEGVKDFRTVKEKLKDKYDEFYQAFVDSNLPLKQIDREMGSNVYTYATNAAYSDNIAGEIIYGNDLTGMEGQYIGPGLRTCLSGVNITDNKTAL